MPDDDRLRWCGSCGTRVRGRGAVALAVVGDGAPVAEPAPTPPAAPPAAVPADDPELVFHLRDPAPRRGTLRSRLAVGAGVAVALGALVTSQLLAQPPEVATPGTGLQHGAGDTGVTSTWAVTDLTPAWSTTGDRARFTVPFAPGRPVLHPRQGLLLADLPTGIRAYDPADGTQVWDLPGLWFSPIEAGPLLVDGLLPIVSGDQLLYVDPADATVVQSATLEEAVPETAVAASAGDVLLVPTPTELRALDRDGTVRWQSTDGWLRGAVDDLVIMQRDGVLLGLSAQDGRPRWEHPTPGWPWIATTPNVALVTGGDDPAAIDLRTGRSRWAVPALNGPPQVVTGGRVLLPLAPAPGTGEDLPQLDAGGLAGVPTILELRDDRTGTVLERWETRRIRHGNGPIAAYEAEHLVISTGQALVGIDDGEVVWQREGGVDHLSGTGLGLVQVHPPDPSLAVLLIDAATGEVRADLGDLPTETWSPVRWGVVGDRVLEGPPRAAAIRDLRTGAVLAEPRGLSGAHEVQRYRDHFLVQTDDLHRIDLDGTERWRRRWSPSQVAFEHARPATASGAYLAITEEGEAEERRVALDPLTGETGAKLPGGILGAELHDGDDRFGLAGSGRDDAALTAWSPGPDGTPAERWRSTAGPRQPPRAITRDEVLTWSPVSVSRWDRETGAFLGQTHLPRLLDERRAAVADGLIVSGSSGETIAAFDTRDGELRWSTVVPDQLGLRLTVAGHVVYVPTERGVTLLDLRDGELLDELELDDVAVAPVVAAHERLVVPTDRGLLVFGPPLDDLEQPSASTDQG